jgi:hypothetical protein
MGFTCSLLGHAYGDPETEREREERGKEVVEVTREVRECDRCGERTVVSENTEVRPVQSDPEPADASADGTDAADPAQSTEAGGETVPEAVASEPAEDDGVILDDDGEVPEERSPGEWPAAEDTRLDDPAETAGAAGETATESAEGGAEIIDADEGSPETAPADADADAAAPESETGAAGTGADVPEDTTVEAATETAGAESGAPRATPGESVADVTGREWPDEGPGADEQGAEGTGIAAAEPGTTGDGGDTVFVCPSCEFHESSQGSSHRQGDICPSCRRGYLAERTRN